jgi:phosphatidylinositol-3-phosphatase
VPLQSSGMLSDIATIRSGRRMVSVLLALAVMTACQPAVPGGTRSTASASPSGPLRHVFVIVLENTSYQLALEQPYISSLADRYALATNYHDLGEPSLPNYLAMTSGSTWGITDNEFHPLPATGIGNQLTKARVSWKAYMEGFTGDCFDSPYPYALKHNPFPYYGDECPPNIVPMTDLAADLEGKTPWLSWITPGLCNDGHDCGVRRADRWLSQFVPEITGSSAWKKDGVLFITWDESNAGDNWVPLLVVAPKMRGEITTRLDHYSLLATISDLLKVPRLGKAKPATSLTRQLQAGRPN